MYRVRDIRIPAIVAAMLSVVALVLIVTVDSSTHASDDPETQPRVLDADEALERQAEHYADTFDVDLETAVYNLRLQRSAGKLQGLLLENESSVYAGQFLEHGPDFRLDVWFTAGNEHRIDQYIDNNDIEPYIEVKVADHSWDDLQTDRKLLQAVMDEVDVEYASETNVRENGISVWVTDINSLQLELDNESLEMPATVSVFETESLESREESVPEHPEDQDTRTSQPSEIIGGRSLEPAGTIGFPVQHQSGAQGFLSAGHLADNRPSLPPGAWNYEGFSTPLQDYWYGTAYDVQWHTAPHHELENHVMVNWSPYETQLITAVVEWLDQGLGDWVCIFGATGREQKCGQIVAVDHHSAAPGECDCFVRVSSPSGERLRYGGDSGAPWYFDNWAYGVHHGGIETYDAIYMPVNRIDSFGLWVMVQ